MAGSPATDAGVATAQALWLSVPMIFTGILHMAIVKARWLQALAVPLDGGRTIGGRPVFGENKTWRGVVVMVFGAAFLGALQGAVFGPWAATSGVQAMDFNALGGSVSPVAATAVGYFLANAVFGFGYVLGELPNSFAKRRLAFAPGKTGGGLVGALFFLLDQADSVIAAFLLAVLVFGLSWTVFFAGVACLTGVHLFINAALFLTKVRRNL